MAGLAPWVECSSKDWDEVVRANEVQIERVEKRNLGHGKGEASRTIEERRRDGLIGLSGELIFARALGLTTGIDCETWKGPDCLGCQIRGTWVKNGHLIVRKSDPDDIPCVLVIMSAPTETTPLHGIVTGWMYAGVAKSRKYPDKTPPHRSFSDKAYWVPNTDLLSVYELPGEAGRLFRERSGDR